MLVDNIGWGDLGCYDGMAPTPRLDQLANEGMRFQNYNVEAQCTPTRSAIMTGRLPKRSGTTFVPLPGSVVAGWPAGCTVHLKYKPRSEQSGVQAKVVKQFDTH